MVYLLHIERNHSHFQCPQSNCELKADDVLKLDFLYAGVLEGNGRWDGGLSRAKAMDRAMGVLRDAYDGKDVFIIGCGCTIGSAIG